MDLLDQAVTLTEIVDEEALQRVCETFAKLHDLAFSIVDDQGLVIVRHGEPSVCCNPAQSAGALGITGAPAHPTVVDALVETATEQTATTCACGARYRIAALRHEGIVLGYAVFGPFVEPSERAPSAVAKSADEVVCKALDGTLKLISVIVQSGYARHLTSQIHIAAIQDAYNELQEKNRRLADSLDRLKELDRVKSSFLATVSHELRTPLTSIIGYSEMMIEGITGELTSQQTDYLHIIMEKGDQLLQIINEILDISKIETGNVQLSYQVFPVARFLEELKGVVMPHVRRKRLTLTSSLEGAQDVQIEADRVKTRQVLLNLLSNAIKFTPDGGTVDITMRTLPGEDGSDALLEVRVSDSGVGVPLESRERIFEAFFQVDGSATRQFGGTGLGLSIVRHFVGAHGGEVWVEDRPDPQESGAVFVVRLPLSRRGGAPAQAGN
ncbi:MAG: PocR ligand-binding domain-containing protein [Deltaproteobacteria bacterium]|nr:PocR ligand-binding domain-containing protein [Deltaproteobacteria bacterium]